MLEEVDKLERALETLPVGAKVITVSYPLEGFEAVDRREFPYTWGTAEVYLQTRPRRSSR
ncbi:MAG: hypothetical protein AB7F31_00975 [Parachlamydiales bacterium]